MCGIAAEYGGARLDEGRRMLDRLVHRGPDDEGEVRVNGSWLGHRRLSIVDVEGGRQPLAGGDPRRGLWLVGNGEVYNFEEVKATLTATPFSTHSDNEVALHLLSQRGPEALCELEGMFAFLAAGDDGFFLAARDPVGIKPLYWARRGEAVRFASEIGAFDAEWRPHVESFPPGCFWTPAEGLRRFATAVPAGLRRAPSLAAFAPEPGTEDLRSLRDTIAGSVARQMMGDVPVGVFLSGGLDSNLVAAVAARRMNDRGETLKTFAVGLAGSADLMAARAAAERLGTEHHERVYTAEEAIDAVPDVVRAIEHFDPSLVRSAVPNHLLAELAAAHVKVVLTGEGADELFAGYEYYRDFDSAESLHGELVRTVEGLHDLNLQRCDRVTMAHGLEARVPFLDRQVIAHALSLPAEWKAAGPQRPEKWLLRSAFVGEVHEDLLWREKSQFGDGSGAASVLTRAAESRVSAGELAAEARSAEPPLRTREELAYFRIFASALEGVRADRTVSRFATA